jgi:hypothetical protein
METVMKSLLSSMLTISLAASPVAGAAVEQVPAPEPRGPIARAITPEAVRLAMEPELSERQKTGEQASPGWSKVRRLEPGTEIIVIVGGAASRMRHAVLSDDSGLTVLNLENPGLTPDARLELLAVASDHPERLSRAGPNFAGRHVRVGPDGVFVADRRIADPGQIVERIARDDVQQIVRPVRRRGSKWGALIGATAGGWLGFGTALTLHMTPCGGSCRDEAASAWAALIGFPIAGGFLGYHAFARRSAEVIYRVR